MITEKNRATLKRMEKPPSTVVTTSWAPLMAPPPIWPIGELDQRGGGEVDDEGADDDGDHHDGETAAQLAEVIHDGHARGTDRHGSGLLRGIGGGAVSDGESPVRSALLAGRSSLTS